MAIIKTETDFPLSMVRGTSQIINLLAANVDEKSFAFQENDKAFFGVKKRATDVDCLILKESMPGVGNQLTFSFVPEDTENLQFGSYYYDIGLQRGEDYYNLIPYSEFRLVPNITEREDNG